MNVILDVNVWISALLWGGTPAKILRLAYQNKIAIFISEEIMLELKTTLKRQKFQKRIEKNGHSIEYLLNFVEDICYYCSSTFLEVEELRDSKNTIILSAGVSAPAQVIITGDLDLLVLVNFNHISILNPQDFLNKYFTKVID